MNMHGRSKRLSGTAAILAGFAWIIWATNDLVQAELPRLDENVQHQER